MELNPKKKKYYSCHWSLVIGHWSLVIDHWSLVIDCTDARHVYLYFNTSLEIISHKRNY